MSAAALTEPVARCATAPHSASIIASTAASELADNCRPALTYSAISAKGASGEVGPSVNARIRAPWARARSVSATLS